MSTASIKPAVRLGSIDAYRGFVMFLMCAEVLEICRVSKAFPDSAVWKFLCFHQSHVEWVGCSLHDLIQPSFSFLVGTALAFSIHSRRARGQSMWGMGGHAIVRSIVLISLGIFLRSLSSESTNFTFVDTLSQIGMGYFALFLVGLGSPRVQWSVFILILIGYWLAFAAYPLPGPDFDWKEAGVAANWEHHASGFAAHWNKNTNLAWAFDKWFMNLFPQKQPFLNNGGGYSSLSFVPTLATMILGLISGHWLRDSTERSSLQKKLIMWGVIGLALGIVLNMTGVCPVVKRIWTPSWVLFSGGWCLLLLAMFNLLVDDSPTRPLCLPLIVFGANSITAYCMKWLFVPFFRSAWHRHLDGPAAIVRDAIQSWFNVTLSIPTEYERLADGCAILTIFWFILFWMYRNRVHVRI